MPSRKNNSKPPVAKPSHPQHINKGFHFIFRVATQAARKLRRIRRGKSAPNCHLRHEPPTRSQLHTHAVDANLTFDGAEGRWKVLQASEIYERRASLSEVYRN